MRTRVAVLNNQVFHKGEAITPYAARRLAADLIAAATQVDGIDCANPWHNTTPQRAKERCPECRPLDATAPVAYVQMVTTVARGEVFYRGQYVPAERLDNGTIIRQQRNGDWTDASEGAALTFRATENTRG